MLHAARLIEPRHLEVGGPSSPAPSPQPSPRDISLDAVVRSPPQSPPPAVELLDHPQPVPVAAAPVAPPLLLPRDLPSSRSSSRRSASSESDVSSGSRVSVAAESQRPDVMDVFMPAGDLEGALRLAVVSIEPPNAFIQAAMMRDLGHLSFDTVPSSVGVCYLRFAS